MPWTSVSQFVLKFYYEKNHITSDLARCTEMKHGNNAFKYIFFQFPSGFGVSSEQLSLILGIFILCACQTRPENSKTPKISCFKLPSPRLHDMKYLSDREHPWQEFRHSVLPRMELCALLYESALSPRQWLVLLGSPVAGNRVTGLKKLLPVGCGFGL